MSDTTLTPETLETLPARLTRLIAEWKAAQSDPADNVRTVADRKLAELVAFHPELVCPPKPDLEGTLIEQLTTLPEKIMVLQTIHDEIDQYYQTLACLKSIDALSERKDFLDKSGNPRGAENERERELAINANLNIGSIVVTAKKNLEALRNLQEARNQFEAARLMVQLLCRGNGK